MRSAYRRVRGVRGTFKQLLSSVGYGEGLDGCLGKWPHELPHDTCQGHGLSMCWSRQRLPAQRMQLLCLCAHLGRARSPWTSRAGRWQPHRTLPR